MEKYTKLIDNELSQHEEMKAEIDKSRAGGIIHNSMQYIKVELRLTPIQLKILSELLYQVSKDKE